MGLSLTFKLILALVVLGCLTGIVITHDNKVRTAQKARDASALLACQSNEDITNKANMTLQLSVHKIDEERQAQSEAVLRYENLWKRAQKVAEDQIAAKAPQLASAQKEKQDAQAKAARSSGKMTCEQELGEINSASSAFAKMRAILFPPEKAPPDGLRIK